ncbi:transposable element Tcb2 transposase [Trichonephila clavipes]|nr:transposable element Tcb2 transposase [Trichonephila clavipes]
MTIVLVCGDLVVNASILPLPYRGTPLPQLLCHCLQYMVTPSIDPWHHMTSQSYVHDILQLHVLPLMQRLPGAIFLQDNARPHMARVSQDCPLIVTTLPWPSRSPDLSLIKLIWDHLGRRVGHPPSLNKLEQCYSKYHLKISRHHTELVGLNARSYSIVHSR